MWSKLYLIGKSRIWFYYYFGQCVLKVVIINNNGLGKRPWIRYQQWSKDSLFSYNEREFFNGFSILREIVKPLRNLKKKKIPNHRFASHSGLLELESSFLFLVISKIRRFWTQKGSRTKKRKNKKRNQLICNQTQFFPKI